MYLNVFDLKLAALELYKPACFHTTPSKKKRVVCARQLFPIAAKSSCKTRPSPIPPIPKHNKQLQNLSIEFLLNRRPWINSPSAFFKQWGFGSVFVPFLGWMYPPPFWRTSQVFQVISTFEACKFQMKDNSRITQGYFDPAGLPNLDKICSAIQDTCPMAGSNTSCLWHFRITQCSNSFTEDVASCHVWHFPINYLQLRHHKRARNRVLKQEIAHHNASPHQNPKAFIPETCGFSSTSHGQKHLCCLEQNAELSDCARCNAHKVALRWRKTFGLGIAVPCWTNEGITLSRLTCCFSRRSMFFSSSTFSNSPFLLDVTLYPCPKSPQSTPALG